MNNSEYRRDPGARAFLANFTEATYFESGHAATYDAVDNPAQRPNDSHMTDISRQQVADMLTASEAKVDARLANFDTSVRTGFADLRADMAKQTAEIHKGTADLIKWAVTLAIAIVGATVGLLTYLNKSAEKPLAAQPAPIVITVPVPTPAPVHTPAAK